MTEQGLSVEELATHEAIELPERELMRRVAIGNVQANTLIAVNTAIAANVLSVGSSATAIAVQDIDQSNEIN